MPAMLITGGSAPTCSGRTAEPTKRIVDLYQPGRQTRSRGSHRL